MSYTQLTIHVHSTRLQIDVQPGSELHTSHPEARSAIGAAYPLRTEAACRILTRRICQIDQMCWPQPWLLRRRLAPLVCCDDAASLGTQFCIFSFCTDGTCQVPLVEAVAEQLAAALCARVQSCAVSQLRVLARLLAAVRVAGLVPAVLVLPLLLVGMHELYLQHTGTINTAILDSYAGQLLAAVPVAGLVPAVLVLALLLVRARELHSC